MKVRNNIEFLDQDRFYAIDHQCLQDLCLILDYLISAVDLLEESDSSLHESILKLQNQIFTIAAIRFSGSL